MPVTRRVFVSMPADQWLSPAQNKLKWGVVQRVEQLGYLPEVFFGPPKPGSLAATKAWTAEAADDVMRHCHGAALIGLPRWVLGAADGPVHMPTEFSHYEGALARTLGLPLLILVQSNVMRRVVFDRSFGPYIGEIPDGANKSWLATGAFKTAFAHWQSLMDQRRDVFFGYSGASAATAKLLKDFMQQGVGATVLDWQVDFRPGRSILDEIEEARVRCKAGVFLFTRDDELATAKPDGGAVPRDNVVFEAGYFASAKGKPRVLIVREKGAKMPADLGGDIYASLDDRNDISPVKETVRHFLERL